MHVYLLQVTLKSLIAVITFRDCDHAKTFHRRLVFLLKLDPQLVRKWKQSLTGCGRL